MKSYYGNVTKVLINHLQNILKLGSLLIFNVQNNVKTSIVASFCIIYPKKHLATLKKLKLSKGDFV